MTGTWKNITEMENSQLASRRQAGPVSKSAFIHHANHTRNFTPSRLPSGLKSSHKITFNRNTDKASQSLTYIKACAKHKHHTQRGSVLYSIFRASGIFCHPCLPPAGTSMRTHRLHWSYVRG